MRLESIIPGALLVQGIRQGWRNHLLNSLSREISEGTEHLNTTGTILERDRENVFKRAKNIALEAATGGMLDALLVSYITIRAGGILDVMHGGDLDPSNVIFYSAMRIAVATIYERGTPSTEQIEELQRQHRYVVPIHPQ
ncbi:MAG: hypothetical protein OXR66_06670 [Candidatus Woesearchaeota archaeon]|nr:hypothetical protein [Candidatus Woesearchaeota archaeon]